MERLAVPPRLSSDEPLEAVTRSLRLGLRTWLDEKNVEGLCQALEALPAGEEAAKDLQLLLADERLTPALRDDTGRGVRALAVAALLRMGFPFALQVDPDDLTLLRQDQRRANAVWLRLGVGATAALPLGASLFAVLGLALSEGGHNHQPWTWVPSVLGLAAVAWCSLATLMAVVKPAASRPPARAARWSLLVAAGLFVAVAGLGIQAGAYDLVGFAAVWLGPLALSGVVTLAASRRLT